MRISALVTLRNKADLIKAVANAPVGAQFDLSDAPRTIPQNRLLWRLLTRISDQVEHAGEKWEAEAWKACFMKAQGAKLRFMPSLDGESVVAVGYKSSHLDKEKFSELIESIYAFGAEHGVDFEAEISLAMRGEAEHGVERRGGASPGSAVQGLARQGEETET